MGEFTAITYRWEWTGNLHGWLIFRLQSVASKYQVLQVVLGRVFPTKDVPRRAGEAWASKSSPRDAFLLSNVLILGFQSCLLSHLLLLSYFLFSSYILRLPWLDLLIKTSSSAASAGNFDNAAWFSVCLGECPCVRPRRNGRERCWICTRTVRYGIDYFSLFLCFYTFGAFLILCFKGKQGPFCISFTPVFGGVHFAVAELFSLTTLYSEMIFHRAPSVTRLWVRLN